MSIASIQNKIQRRVKHHLQKNEYQDIGTFIKKRRKELNITQEIVSHGICSVSYLSKIENNQIVPNEFFVREIMNKLNVPEDISTTLMQDEEYLKTMIRGYFYEDQNAIDLAFNQIKQTETGTLYLLGQLIKGVSQKDPQLYILIAQIEDLIMNLNDFEIKTFLLFTSLFYIQKEDFKSAFDVLHLMESVPYHNKHIEGLYHIYSYMTKQRLQMKNLAVVHYHPAQQICRELVNTTRANRLLLQRIRSIKNEHSKKALSLLKEINRNQLGDEACLYDVLYAEVLIELSKYQEAIIKLNRIKEDSSCYFKKLVLLYQVSLHEGDLDMQNSISDIIKNLHTVKSDQKYKVLYHSLYLKDQERQKEFLKDIAIPYSIRSSDLVYLKEYTDRVMKICIRNSRYKEATQHYQKYQKEIQRINELVLNS